MQPRRLLIPILAALAAACGCFSTPRDGAHRLRVFEFPFVHDYSIANSCSFRWHDSFLSAPSSVYSQDIAGPLSALAASTYGYRLGMDVRTLREMGFNSSSLFRKYGDDIDYRHPIYGKNQTGLTLALKRVWLDGSLRDVLMIVVRGTFGRSEWLSNMNACNEWGRSPNPSPESRPLVHEGFSRAADCAFDILSSFVASNRIDFSTAKVVVTGHSRGAAVANLIGARLNDAARSPAPSSSAAPYASLDPSNLFVYTFASPNVVLGSGIDCKSPRYSNIFNVINPEDIVPTVPISRWNSQRYGIDLHLKNYDSLSLPEVWFDPAYNEMKNSFKEMTGYEWWHTPFGTNSTQIVPAILGAVAPTVEDLYAVPHEQRADGNLTSIHSILETLIYRSLKDPDEAEESLSIGSDVRNMTRAYSTVSKPEKEQSPRSRYFRILDGRDFTRQPGMFDVAWRLACMHATQTYIGWMKAAEKFGPSSIYKSPQFKK